MKQLILLIFILNCGFVNAQSHSIGDPDDWAKSNARVKVMLISAEWCGYCRESPKLFEQSELLGSLSTEEFSYFGYPENWLENFRFQDRTFNYFASGPDQGRHSFVDYLFA